MKKDKHKTIRRDAVFGTPEELSEDGYNLDDAQTLDDLHEDDPEWDPVREHATNEMFGETQDEL